MGSERASSAMRAAPIPVGQRLHKSQLRLVRAALRALALYETWSELNTESPERQALVVSPVTQSIGVMWEASLDRLVLILMSTLDAPGNRGVHGSDRVSFRVFQALLDQPGVLDILVADARNKHRGEFAAARAAAVLESADRLRARLDALDHEHPSRIRRLRAVRDRFIAHDLDLAAPLDPPIYQSLRTMTDEVLALAEDATRVLAPTVIVWPRGDVARHTRNLVKAIALQHPLRIRGAGEPGV